jgi:hypothetical protein
MLQLDHRDGALPVGLPPSRLVIKATRSNQRNIGFRDSRMKSLVTTSATKKIPMAALGGDRLQKIAYDARQDLTNLGLQTPLP